MDDLDRRLLDEVQRRFPLEERPYLRLGERLGLSEAEVMERLEALKGRGILRQIGAIFNPQALGYRTTLVAAAVPGERVSAAAAVINAHPGVSHNYLRDHRFNLWFTVACPPGEDLEALVSGLVARAGVEEFLLLPIRRVFRIAVVLSLSDNGEEAPVAAPRSRGAPADPPDARTVALVRTTQEDLPRVPRPFALWAEGLALPEGELLSWLRAGLESGLIRRFAGLVKHTRAGFRGNVMVAWQVPEERVEEVGMELAGQPGVTHCYERVSYPHWPYNLYTMLHASRTEGAVDFVRRLARRLGLSSFLPLVTVRELKKTRLKLFWSER